MRKELAQWPTWLRVYYFGIIAAAIVSLGYGGVLLATGQLPY